MAALSLSGIIDAVIDKEVGGLPNGGYTNDPLDPGGETKWGISKRSYPELDIKNLTREQAAAIYMRDFIVAPHFDKLPPSPLRHQVIDFGVNSGQRTATKALQRLLGVTVDGTLGLETLTATQHDNLSIVNNLLMVERVKFLVAQVVKTPRKARFINGWIKRATSFLTP